VLQKATEKTDATKVELPDVPTQDPGDDQGHASKKQKSGDDEKL
jgi:hypothetical protein